jgi:restriction system protein
MMPPQVEIEVPLLRALVSLGGKAAARDVYAAVTKQFPQLTEVDTSEPLPSGNGNRWTNRIQWVRQTLVSRGEVTSAGYGVWAVTDKGLARLQGSGEVRPATAAGKTDRAATPAPKVEPLKVEDVASVLHSANLEELAEEYAAAFEKKVIQTLLDLEPARFELFATKLMTAYGFRTMKVTNDRPAPDGGIDGDGELKVGLATMRAAFQCKKWQGSVGRPEIDKFRGAIQGQFEHGYFFATSTFSIGTRQVSIKAGAVPVYLFDGHEIVQLMIEKGLGITRRRVEIYDDSIETLFESD